MHECKSKYITKVNEKLTELQRFLNVRKNHLNEGVEEDVSMDEIERVIEREVENVSDDEAHHASNLLTIIKDKPRDRVKSGVLIFICSQLLTLKILL